MLWGFDGIMDWLHGLTGVNKSGGLKGSRPLKGNIILNCYDVRAATRAGYWLRMHGVEKLHQATSARTCRWWRCHAAVSSDPVMSRRQRRV
jgi:hypothetical protein